MAFRLLGLQWAVADEARIGEARDALLGEQRADGGWSQLPTLESDAYATGLALFALHQGGRIVASHQSFRRGIDYLLGTQFADGSWFVQTRSFPLQPFVGTRFPHGRSQFISLAATCGRAWHSPWAGRGAGKGQCRSRLGIRPARSLDP